MYIFYPAMSCYIPIYSYTHSHMGAAIRPQSTTVDTEQLHQSCWGLSTLLKGTSAVVFEKGESVIHSHFPPKFPFRFEPATFHSQARCSNLQATTGPKVWELPVPLAYDDVVVPFSLFLLTLCSLQQYWTGRKYPPWHFTPRAAHRLLWLS